MRVRRAVALATDKKEVVLGVWRGFAQPVNQWMPPGTPWFFNVPDRKVDVEQAKKLLAEAGIAKGAKLTHTVGTVANLVPAAQVFQAQLTRIGIDLQLEVLDWPAYIKRQRAMDFTSTNTNFFPKVDPGRRVLPLLPLQGRRQRAIRRLREPGGRQAAGRR